MGRSKVLDAGKSYSDSFGVELPWKNSTPEPTKLLLPNYQVCKSLPGRQTGRPGCWRTTIYNQLGNTQPEKFWSECECASLDSDFCSCSLHLQCRAGAPPTGAQEPATRQGEQMKRCIHTVRQARCYPGCPLQTYNATQQSSGIACLGECPAKASNGSFRSAARQKGGPTQT